MLWGFSFLDFTDSVIFVVLWMINRQSLFRENLKSKVQDFSPTLFHQMRKNELRL